jgi:hypothetical protein
MITVKNMGVWLCIVAMALTLAACSKRMAELKVKYPVEGSRHTILDEEELSALGIEEVKGLYESDIKALMGKPAEIKLYYERKENERFFPAGKVLVRSDDWTYDSNGSTKQVTVKLEDKVVTAISIKDK